jgi:hypothetical protein
MFCLRIALLSMRRRRSKSTLVALTCAAVVVFVFFYMNNIDTNRKELLSLPQALPVAAQIENLSGSRIVGLEIQEKLVDQIASSGFIRDLRYTTRLAANFPSVPDEINKFKTISIIGVNDIRAVPDLQEGQGERMDGLDTDFLRGQDALCLADAFFLKENGLSVGETVDLALYALKADQNGISFVFVPLGNRSLRIVGTLDSVTAGDQGRIDLICPAGWAKEKATQAGEDFYLDSASFTVARPLELNAFKEAMKGLYLLPVNPMAEPSSIKGCALSVKDEAFIATAGRVKNNLATLYSFAFVIFIVIAAIGYAIAYLLMQGRRIDIAVMRSLGTSRKDCAKIMLVEYGALGLAGCLLGALCAALWLGPAWSALWLTPPFLASLMLGILAAALQISRLNTMTGLVKTES